MKHAIITERLSLSSKGRPQLNEISLHVPSGAIYTLFGRTDAGKTTLLRLLAGELKPDSGRILLFGSEAGDGFKDFRNYLNLVTDESFYPYMSALDNLRYLCRVRGIPNDRKESASALDLLNVKRPHVPVKELDQEEIKRVSVASAFIGRPEIILLDEPFVALDTAMKTELFQVLEKLSRSQNVTFLITSNIISDTSIIGTHCGFLEKGRLLQEISSIRLEESLQAELVLRVDKTALAVTAIEQNLETANFVIDEHGQILLRGHMKDQDTISDILYANDIKIRSFYVSSLTIQEYFLTLTGGSYGV